MNHHKPRPASPRLPRSKPPRPPVPRQTEAVLEAVLQWRASRSDRAGSGGHWGLTSTGTSQTVRSPALPRLPFGKANRPEKTARALGSLTKRRKHLQIPGLNRLTNLLIPTPVGPAILAAVSER